MSDFIDEIKSILRSAIAQLRDGEADPINSLAAQRAFVAGRAIEQQKRGVRSLLRRLNRQIEQANEPDIIFTDIYHLRRGNR